MLGDVKSGVLHRRGAAIMLKVEMAKGPERKIFWPVGATGFMMRPRQRVSRFLRILGPGLITGAADDDPSGIATYSQTGAQFGYGQLWTVLFLLPLMTAVQEACARIGAVTGQGLAANVKAHYSRRALYAVVMLVVAANIINIGTDLGAMAAATQLVLPWPFTLIALVFVGAILLGVIFTSYRTYVRLLKWLALALLAYPATAIIVGQNWGQVLRATFSFHFEWSSAYLYMIVGVLGTTISPYLFFWEASEVVEEEIAEHRLAQGGGTPRLSARFLRNLRLDNAVGMIVSQLIMFFIIITGAAVLHQAGITDIKSAADAARALEPLVKGFPNAGLAAKLIFASGIVGLGLLAVPVLAGSASYALSEVMGWREGLFRKFAKARGFYIVIIISTLIGLGINFVGINPVKALIFTAVFNGVAAIPLVFLIAKLSSRADIMGEHASGRLSRILLWLTFAAMALAAVAMFATIGRG